MKPDCSRSCTNPVSSCSEATGCASPVLRCYVRAMKSNSLFRIGGVMSCGDTRATIRGTSVPSKDNRGLTPMLCNDLCVTEWALRRGDGRQVGHWGSASRTAAMGRSAVVALKVGSNDRLVLQATSGFDPQEPFGFSDSTTAVPRQEPLGTKLNY